MSSSRPLSLPPPASPRPSHPWWLEGLARYLADDDRVPHGPQLVWVVSPPDDERRLGPVLSFSPLDPDDPLADLYGLVTPPDVATVAFVGDVRARRVDEAPPRRIVRDGRLVHLLHRDGTEVRALPGGLQGPAAVTAPTRQPSAGRVGDACRRMLGLSTAPPPTNTLHWWVDCWAQMVFLLAIEGEDTTWRAIAAATIRDRAGTPSVIAQTLVFLGRTMSWADLYTESLEHARSHGEDDDDHPPRLWPFCHQDVLEWMDVGMFARARLGHQPPLATLLGELDDILEPDVADLVRATVTLALGEAGAAARR
jgi:hypothetical protein